MTLDDAYDDLYDAVEELKDAVKTLGQKWTDENINAVRQELFRVEDAWAVAKEILK